MGKPALFGGINVHKIQRVFVLSLLLIMALPVMARATTSRALAAPPRQTAPATSAAGANTCDELQVIAIADQSGSMSGYSDPNSGRYYPPTDPGGMRFDGPRYIVDTLLDLHPRGFDSSKFKAAVIDFGNVPQVRLNWVDLNPLTESEAIKMRNDLAATFGPTAQLGNTVPGTAVQQASSLFAQLDGLRPQVDGCPRRVIILFTDGLPFDDTPGFSWSAHLADLAGYARAYLPSQNYDFYVIGLDQSDAFYKQTLEAWAEVTGDPARVLLARNSGEMGSHIARILYENLAETGTTATVRGCAENGKVIVPPYMQLVRFTLFKVDPTLRLEIEDPSGRQVSDNQPGVTTSGQNGVVETVTVNNPSPGEWKILTQLPANTEDQCLVNFIAIAAVEEVVDPQGGATYSQYTKVPVVFQLVDSMGNALPDYGQDRYNLQMDVKLGYDSGEEQILSLSVNPGQQYRGEVIPYYTGSAAVVVDATAQDDNAKKYDIFPKKPVASFQVSPVSFTGRKVPADGLRVGQHTELPLEFAVVDATNQPIELDLPVSVKITLVDPDGQPASLPAPVVTKGVYSSTLLLAEPGAQKLEYSASVTIPPQGNQPEREVVLGSGQISFDVFPVHKIHAEFGEMGGVATDPFLRATGLPGQIKLVDEAGNLISPASTGVPDPMRIFDVSIIDQGSGEVVLEGADLLVPTGEPGVFQLVNNDLGRGRYTIKVQPATTLAEDFSWESTEWTSAATGRMNSLFWAVVAAAAGAIGLVGIVTGAQIRVRQHPMSGTIQIYERRYVAALDGEEGKQDMEERVLWKGRLPGNKNKQVIRPKGVKGITKIVVTTPNEATSKQKSVTLDIYRQKAVKQTATLLPGGRVDVTGTTFFIEKDQRAADDNDLGGAYPLDGSL